LERPIIYGGPGSETKETIQVKVGTPADPAAGGAGDTTGDPFGLGTPASGGAAAPSDPFKDPFGSGTTTPAPGGTTTPAPGGTTAPDPFKDPFSP
jgi:hypothetical protein